MPNTSSPCGAANLALLLIESGTLVQSERAAQLAESRFCVTKADHLRDIYLMRDAFRFSVAVLSDTIGFLALRASAQVVRGHWPKARIVLLGTAPIQFDDYLYDESVGHASDGTTLLAMLDKVMKDPWSQRDDPYAAWFERVRITGRPRQHWPTEESDPTKMSRLATDNYTRDQSEREQLRHMIR